MAHRQVSDDPDKTEWRTPAWLFRWAQYECGEIDLDAASTNDNRLVANNYTEEDDALVKQWFGNVWVNPPYGRGIGHWVKKAAVETTARRAKQVVMLLPVSTDTKWWSHVMGAQEVCYLQGRVRFHRPDGSLAGLPSFGSCLAVFRRSYRNWGLPMQSRIDRDLIIRRFEHEDTQPGSDLLSP